MKDIQINRLVPSDAPALSKLLTTDDNVYRQYFIPFPADFNSLEVRLGTVREDRYWGIWYGGNLAGFFMMRGFDEGYQRPSFGVYIAQAYSRKGLSGFALDYCMCWCRVNSIETMMLKVHPDNHYARQTYEKAGFSALGICHRTGHTIMEKSWRRD
ncbi:GNAT family N-acetyltransferase [Geobacter sp. AOG1]|uniref:GNAT family N-acetyltransferase n=1 Tax=Geobacter sp. AOG1 TaxID=1566346 RepID=UPI001CC66D41|nr:GNAT family N-acetyltransferase [Geobacter sp. AOG1]